MNPATKTMEPEAPPEIEVAEAPAAVEAVANALTPVAPARPPQETTTLTMLNQAVEAGASVDVLDKLLGLHERWEAGQARKAFDQALASAKADIQPIRKNREVDFTSNKGRTNYRHEDLGEIARVIDPVLARHGLSYRFRTEQKEGGVIRVTCVLSHREGHNEENSLEGGRDESGNKNNLQAVGSSITYLQRYTLKAALGLAVSADDDARTIDAGPISQKQYDSLRLLMDETEVDTRQFCDWLGVDAVANLPAARFSHAKQALLAKKVKLLEDRSDAPEPAEGEAQ